MAGCGCVLVFFGWAFGITCLIGCFFVQPRDQWPVFFTLGIASIIAAYIIYRLSASALEREEEERKGQILNEYLIKEQEENKIAHMEGLKKYCYLDEMYAQQYEKSIDSFRQLGNITEKSVYQEKEHNWAVLGGLAEGIAGPAAGMATAAKAIKDNERIKEENAARREWAANQKKFYENAAREAYSRRPIPLTMSELEEKFEVVLSWKPETLFSMMTFNSEDTVVYKNKDTGAITVETSWAQNKYKSICIDGSIRAKLYTDDGTCAGCAYLNLPKEGTKELKGKLSGTCAKPKPSNRYSVVLEPMNLWELASKKKNKSHETDNLTDKEHRKIVSDGEAKFLRELNQM